ncbi:MAG: hypothetical protein AAF441_15425 [Pseudomonadota bacterium]
MKLNEASLARAEWPALLKKVGIPGLAGSAVALVLEPDHTASLPPLSAFGLWFSHIL